MQYFLVILGHVYCTSSLKQSSRVIKLNTNLPLMKYRGVKFSSWSAGSLNQRNRRNVCGNPRLPPFLTLHKV